MSEVESFFKSAFSVDNVIFGFDGGELKVLLIQRGAAPFKGKWALPGDLVYPNENLETAAERVLEQLTGLRGVYLEQVKAFGAVNRHPLGRVITIASPSQRTQQTAAALGRKLRLRYELLPEAPASAVLALAGWPDGRGPVVIVGHQPTLGQVVAQLLELPEGECPMRKGAIWWLRQRERGGRLQTVIVTVQTPELV